MPKEKEKIRNCSFNLRVHSLLHAGIKKPIGKMLKFNAFDLVI